MKSMIPPSMSVADADIMWEELNSRIIKLLPAHFHDLNAMDEPVCGCATCREAYEAGLKGAIQLIEQQCPAYLLVIGQIYTTIGMQAVARMNSASPIPDEGVKAYASACVDEALDFARIAIGHTTNARACFEAVEKAVIACETRVLKGT